MPNGVGTQIRVSSVDVNVAKPPMQTQADLGLYCALFCAAPSNVGYAANIGKGPNVVVFQATSYDKMLFSRKIFI